MDYASFKLNLTAIGLDTKALDDAVIISDGERQVGKVFLDRTHKFIIDTIPLESDRASRLLNNIWLFTATPIKLRGVIR